MTKEFNIGDFSYRLAKMLTPKFALQGIFMTVGIPYCSAFVLFFHNLSPKFKALVSQWRRKLFTGLNGKVCGT